MVVKIKYRPKRSPFVNGQNWPKVKDDLEKERAAKQRQNKKPNFSLRAKIWKKVKKVALKDNENHQIDENRQN